MKVKLDGAAYIPMTVKDGDKPRDYERMFGTFETKKEIYAELKAKGLNIVSLEDPPKPKKKKKKELDGR